jgi:pimeloyl-ACP methyl ester carboxylesterase
MIERASRIVLLLIAVTGAGGATELPALRGPLRIGTTTLHMVDRSRRDPVHNDRPREMMIQLWYPADYPPNSALAPYLPSERLPEAFANQKDSHIPAQTIPSWQAIRTHAALDAKVRRGRFPLLTFSIGLGLSRASYTTIVSEVASHGYIVAAIDHPYGGLSVLPDGRTLSIDDDSRSTDDDRAREWAADIRFVVSKLLTLDAFAPHIDRNRIGSFGHSSGGAAALEAAHLDPRIGAACDMDGGPFGGTAEHGVPKPFLLMRSQPLYSDADLAKLGRTRAQWDEMGAKVRATFEPVFDKYPDIPKFQLQIAGTGHMSFSDAPFLMPEMLTRFGGEILPPEKTLMIVTEYLVAFFDEGLLGRRSVLLHGNAAPPVSLKTYGNAK